jgi:flagellar basal-body rod protein FlgG
LYTRAGALTVNADGLLVVASADRGRPIEPAITIPQDAETIAISESGIVSVQQAGTPGLTQVGEIQLARFLNPEGLLAKGDNLYAESAASGTPLPGTPGDLGFGVLRQGFLELSNTEPVRELIGLITTQRNFELNSQVIQAADQMLQLTANLRRF